MVAVLTGDIINSSKGKTEDWIVPLKEVLNQYGKAPLDWEIFRGDSFQLLIEADKAILAAIHLKASIKQSKLHDVRLGIGIGKIEYKAKNITECNGSAFIKSGESFDALKKHSLHIQSANKALDHSLNLMLKLALLGIDNWTSVVSKVIKTAIENPKLNQSEWAKLLNRSQGNISETLKRGGYDEMMSLNDFYVKSISQL